MSCQIAGEKIGNRLTRIAFLFLGLTTRAHGRVTALPLRVLDDFTVRVDAHATDDSFAIHPAVCFGYRRFVFGPDETAFDAGAALIVERDECPAKGNLLRIIGMP